MQQFAPGDALVALGCPRKVDGLLNRHLFGADIQRFAFRRLAANLHLQNALAAGLPGLHGQAGQGKAAADIQDGLPCARQRQVDRTGQGLFLGGHAGQAG